MKKSVAMKWVKALRSGAYRQGKGSLRNIGTQDKMCCLGVLCDISNTDKWNSGHATPTYHGCSLVLPDIVAEYAGMKSQEGLLEVLNCNLAKLNDGCANTPSLTFDEIADIIQIFYKEL